MKELASIEFPIFNCRFSPATSANQSQIKNPNLSLSEVKESRIDGTESTSEILHSRVLYCLAALSLILASSSCVSTWTHPDADFEMYVRAAVVPFANNTEDSLAGEKITAMFTAELVAADYFDEVVEPGLVTQFLKENSVTDNLLSLDLMKKMGKDLEVHGIIFGTVDNYDLDRIGNESFPSVSLTVRMVDVETGKIVWTACDSENGSAKTPIIRVGEIYTLPDMTRKVCRRIVGTLP